MQSINPANGNTIEHFTGDTDSEVQTKISLTSAAQKAWAGVPIPERKKPMLKLADLLRTNAGQYAKLMTAEMGKPIRESRAEVEKCAWVCDYYALQAGQFLEEEVIQTDASRSYVRFDPLGVILAVMPWNFPFWQVFRFAAPTLMAGNGGLLKHASNVCGCALAIEDLFLKAGFPANLFQSLIISAGQVSKVITADEVKAVTLTGSEPAGSAVASLAGKLIKKTVLELGGSDPFIVLRDADLSKCADTAITARFLNGGQSCIAAKRFIVDASAAREFEKMIQNRMDKLIVGDPMNEKTDIGPLARPEFVNELDRQVQNSIRQGARLVTGGARGESPGNFYQPTLLCDVTDRMDVFQQETFGPVFVIIPVKDEKTAIKLANDSEFGLGASLWTKDPEKGEKLAAQINAGSVFINGMVKSDPRLPFGGIKKSGYGRELSHYGIREFVNIKTVWIQ